VEELRKWRKKILCRYCRNEKSSGSVIKCKNTKCKFVTHIPCAIDKGLIIPLDYMCDFYSINIDSLEEELPLYCSNHNRDLMKSHKEYLKELKEAIHLARKEIPNIIASNNMCNYKEPKTDLTAEDEGMTNLHGYYSNIINLNHPEFDYSQDKNFNINNSSTPKKKKQISYNMSKY
jgi:hypothetical protein